MGIEIGTTAGVFKRLDMSLFLLSVLYVHVVTLGSNCPCDPATIIPRTVYGIADPGILS